MKSKLLSLILMLIAVLIVSVQPICLAQEEVVEEEEEAWGGADGEAGDMITVINPDYEPWFESIWEPPSGEIESMLFSLQAAIGALIIGLFFGYNYALKKQESQTE
ncbi:MAG: energy-coupling factor ABC transporter substrate-binding protein [Methanosarcinales archaeon]|nr:energy-coupling factor ABC transporter substrate-binding protein [Methanosarcinales archaeon]